MSNNGKLRRNDTVAEMRQVAPPVHPVETLRRNLLYSMFKAVTADDMEDIVRKQVEKAKDGDAKAARLLIDMVRSGDAGTPVFMSQTVMTGDQTNAFLSDLRRNIVNMLAMDGPRTVEFIAHQMQVVRPRIEQALEHEWFEREQDGWHLTAKARSEVLERAE